MAAAPWHENPLKVVIEFQKSNEGASRSIRLRHAASVLPPQLAGRIHPAVWHAFMTDIDQAAQQHPYVVSPSAGRMGGWLGAACMGAVLGCCIINPDGGDYGVWLPQVQGIIDRHQAAFAAGGAVLSLQRAQNSYWVQIDVNQAMAMGQPAPQPGPEGYSKPGYEPQKPGYEPQKPGYEPQKPGYEPPRPV